MARGGAGNGITLQQLRYFIEVAAEGSISAAADLLYVSQPTMSAAMKDLERRAGRALFTRSTRGITLTTDGTEFLGYARQVVEQAELLEQRYLGRRRRDDSWVSPRSTTRSSSTRSCGW